MLVDGPFQFDAPSGFMVPPQWFAMWARRHQHRYGSTSEDLGQIAITFRNHAMANPHAFRREPLTMEQYLAGRWIKEPFRVFDCTTEVDGACAILVAGEDVARDTKQPPVWLVSSANMQNERGGISGPILSTELLERWRTSSDEARARQVLA